jgi:hypothetical protein
MVGVARLTQGAYVKLYDIFSRKALGSDTRIHIELIKLRGKKVERCPRKSVSDEKIRDTNIVHYPQTGGRLKSEVLLVKY